MIDETLSKECREAGLQLADTLLEQCVIFSSSGGFPNLNYEQSHNAVLGSVIVTLARLIAGTFSDPEDVINTLIMQLKSKKVRQLIAGHRKIFLDNLAKHKSEQTKNGKSN